MENIDKSLSDYNLRFSEHPCCKRGCQRILSSQLLVYCRSQYVLLPSYKERNAFLDKQAQFKKDGKKWNNFFLQTSEGQHVQVCREAWLLAYGISKGTYKKRSATSQVIGSENKKTKRRREGTLDKEMLFIHWLIRQAQKIGDKLPHGDGRPNVHQIRLPYPNKQVVWFLFSEFSKKQFFVPSNRHCLSYEDATQIWKHHPELQHIKMIRYKGSFSVCKVCLGYELQIKGQLTVAQREEADRNFKAHITETKKERAQYAKDQIKCTEERDKFCIIIDSIDKYKTTFPFFVNAPKSVMDDATLVTTKLTAAMVHGVGSGVYCFWATDQVNHDTNLTVEVLRRTLLKIEESEGKLPQRLYLQLDNAKDNKSAQFLAFIAFLVELHCFECIKVSYLIVGHTHEIIDQWFSVLSKFVKRVLMQVLTIAAFIQALLHGCFKTEKCIPKCVEQVECCYDTKPLYDLLDKQLHRFDLHESTNDKVHHFIFRRNETGKCVMQYKLKRYSNAIYPRKYPSLGSKHESSEHGSGSVVNFEAMRDENKHKYWKYTIMYEKANGATIEEIFTQPARQTCIVMFPDGPNGASSFPTHFELAPFHADHSTTIIDQKASIAAIFQKLNLSETHAHELQWWDQFFSDIPAEPAMARTIQPFKMPKARSEAIISQVTRNVLLPIDNGIRDVDVVTHSNFTPTMRRKANLLAESQILAANRLDELKQGFFVVVNVKPMDKDGNDLQWYPWQYVIAEIDTDVSQLDTTQEKTEFQVQVYRPSGNTLSLDKKFIKWQGGDNHYWRPTIERGTVKAVVELHRSSKKLTKKFKEIILSLFF